MPLVLNWREIEKAAQAAHAELAGQHVEQWIVPERPRYPGGFLKGEWLLRTGGRKSEGLFLFSVRPRHPYFAYRAGKGPKAAQTGTRSPFDLAVSKQVKGRRIHSLVALKKERIVVLWMESGGAEERLGLVLSLIPATPEALLVEGRPEATSWRILARSRANSAAQESDLGHYTAPAGLKAPADPLVREDLFKGPDALWRAVDADLDAEAFQARLTIIQRELRGLAAKARERLAQSEEAVDRGEDEPDWQHLGDLLKSVLHDPPAPDAGGNRMIPDYTREGILQAVPCDPRFGAGEQVAKFYSLAKRKSRRISEGLARKSQFESVLARFERELASMPTYPNWAEIERLERVAGIERTVATEKLGKRPGVKGSGWMGRTFRSREGLPIYVGKTNAENLELTFKVARGNDVWMHVRGRPGAHVLIPLPQGKSAALETLLDAAVLAVYFSGGESWGKTEVDYTFKKHVKRIKDSTEASYTHNRTLIVEPEKARLKRLLESDEH